MPRQAAAVEVNRFVGGLVTDASPLAFPENCSLDEENMVLNIDGSRNRRLGLDFEKNAINVVTSIQASASPNLAFSSFKWTNAGGIVDKDLLVVQVGNEFKVFDLDYDNISSHLIYTAKLIYTTPDQIFSFTVVDGILTVVSGEEYPSFFIYNSNGSITQKTASLLIRDFFGVEDIVNGVNLYDPVGIQRRPTTLPNPHLYNLRNQSWAIPRLQGGRATVMDPIRNFIENRVSSPTYPSNSDSVNQALYADPANEENRTIERFFGNDIYFSPMGTSRVAQGYFIIDALKRGASRLANEAANRITYPQLQYAVTSLPEDRTPGGPTAVGEFAGRVWYGGFSGEVIGGDSLSPRLSSYVLFSQVVNNQNDMVLCYPVGDPTSKTDPDIVDTDGGFIRLNGAFGIQKLVNVGTSLIAIASNGVWRILGTDDNGFTATRYTVEKISDRGCSSRESIVLIDNTIMYWGQDGIYHAKTDQYGAWSVEELTTGRIRSLYKNISESDKARVRGSYDSFENKARWLWNNSIGDADEVRELILDITLTAFYTNRIKQPSGASLPKVVGFYKAKTYSDPVNDSLKETGYIIVTNIAGSVSYKFGAYTNMKFKDFGQVDASAYLITGYMSGGDNQRDKGVPYITTYFKRTEDGFDTNMVPKNQSSCRLQSMWEWANSSNSNKWGRPFQAYRYNRLYMPANSNDPFNTGQELITTKSKLRGNGRTLSLKFSTEPEKDLHLYGWSMVMSVAGNV